MDEGLTKGRVLLTVALLGIGLACFTPFVSAGMARAFGRDAQLATKLLSFPLLGAGIFAPFYRSHLGAILGLLIWIIIVFAGAGLGT